MDGRTSPRLEEPLNRNEKRNAVPKMLQNGDVKGDGRFKVSITSFLKTVKGMLFYLTSYKILMNAQPLLKIIESSP